VQENEELIVTEWKWGSKGARKWYSGRTREQENERLRE